MAGAAGSEFLVGLAGQAWRELSRRRLAKMGSMINLASEALPATAEEVLAIATASPAGCQLLFDSIQAASETFWDTKIEALALALADGLRDDQANIDEQQLIVGVLNDLEPPHVRVLALLSKDVEAAQPLTPAEIQVGAKVSDSNSVMPVLVRHGLAGPPPLPEGSMRWMSTPEASFQIMPFGLRVLGYLRSD